MVTRPQIPAPVRQAARSITGHGGGIWFMGSLTVANLSNFAFHAIASYRMGPATYGALGTLLGVTLAVSLPAAALQVATTKAAAQSGEAPASSARRLAVSVATTVAGVAVLIAASGSLVASFLRLDSTIPVFWMAAFLVPAFAGSVLRGALFADGRLAAIATAVVAGAVFKVTIAWYLFDHNTDLATATALVWLTELLVTLGLAWCTRSRLGRGTPLRLQWRDLLVSTAAFWGMWTMLAVDLAVARHFLTAENAGVYVATATVARSVLFVPQSIALVAHSRMVHSEPAEAKRILHGALAVTGAFCAAAVGVTSVAGGPAIERIFGSDLRPGPALLGTLAATAGLLAVTNLFIHYRLALGLGTGRVWVGPIMIGSVAWLLHGSSVQISLAAGIGAVICLAAITPPPVRPKTTAPPGSPPMPVEGDLDVSVIIAANGPEPVTAERINDVLEVMDETALTFEVIVLAAAAQYGPLHDLDRPEHSGLAVIEVPELHGWGTSIQVCASRARGRQIVTLDAAHDLSAEHIPAFLDLLTFYGADAVVGSKRHPASVARYPLMRRLTSRMYQLLVLALFRLSVRDTQVGLKAFTRETLVDALPHVAGRGPAFDIELLTVAHRVAHRRIIEAPVTMETPFGSAVKWRAAAVIVAATISMRGRIRSVTPPIAAHYPPGQRPRVQTIDLVEHRDKRALVVPAPLTS